MYEWATVQKIIDESVPRIALEKLREMDREVSGLIDQATDHRARLHQRIKNISSALGEEIYYHVGDDLTTRQRIINVLHDAERPLSAKEISNLISDVKYTKVWRYITEGYQDQPALADEPFVTVQGEGRMRRYLMKSGNRERK